MPGDRAPPLSKEDVVKAFRLATGHMEDAKRRWQKRAEQGLDDKQLAAALEFELGTLGGSYGPDIAYLEYQGDGLNIWASHGRISRHTDPPLLRGADTMRMARLVYGIRDPDHQQLVLF